MEILMIIFRSSQQFRKTVCLCS